MYKDRPERYKDSIKIPEYGKIRKKTGLPPEICKIGKTGKNRDFFLGFPGSSRGFRGFPGEARGGGAIKISLRAE